MPEPLEELALQWSSAKSLEGAAINERRNIEDKLLSLLCINMDDGVVNRDINGISIKVTMRQNRKIDGNALTLMYKDNRIPQFEIDRLFRWKPELNLKEWKTASNEVKAVVSSAITTQPGRPTFNIELEGN